MWERLPETITLSVDNPVIHPYGTKFKSQTQAVVRNSDNPKVTYTFKCDTGDISGLTFDKEKGTVSTEISRTTRYAYKNKRVITITATLPSGTSASVQVTIEPTLTITYKNVSYDRFEGNRQKTSDYGDYGKDNVYTANQKVSWQHGFKSDEATRTTITDTTATYSAPKSVPGPYLEYKATTPAGQVLEIETEWAIN